MRAHIFAVACSASLATAHYTFDVLVVDGIASESWQYIRENTRVEKYMPTKFINSPSITPLDTDFTCNEGANTNAANTEVATVAPGSSIAFKLAYGATMQHPGPAQVYMSQAPNNVTEYNGDGQWFKIFGETICSDGDLVGEATAWCTWDRDSIDFTIPLNTPPGQYLLRAEHIGLHGAQVGEAEFYYSCAQVEVTGTGTGQPSPLVSIPGVYAADDAAINYSLYGATEYPFDVIGPEVWDGSEAVPIVSPDPASSATSSTASVSETEAPTLTPTTSLSDIVPDSSSSTGHPTKPTVTNRPCRGSHHHKRHGHKHKHST